MLLVGARGNANHYSRIFAADSRDVVIQASCCCGIPQGVIEGWAGEIVRSTLIETTELRAMLRISTGIYDNGIKEKDLSSTTDLHRKSP